VNLLPVQQLIEVPLNSAVHRHDLVERGRKRCRDEGLDDRIRFIHADACSSGLPTASADFVWGEDAWCYVTDKPKLIAEAARLVRPGGVIAFTDWVEGPTELNEMETQGHDSHDLPAAAHRHFERAS
jgi:SAM-dependent methyltransferase